MPAFGRRRPCRLVSPRCGSVSTAPETADSGKAESGAVNTESESENLPNAPKTHANTVPTKPASPRPDAEAALPGHQLAIGQQMCYTVNRPRTCAYARR